MHSHFSDVAVLDLAAEKDVILFCLPSHITQCLQSLDRSLSRPLKAYWRQNLRFFIYNKLNRKVSRLQFVSLLKAAWSKTATVGNGSSGFSATEVYTYNLQTIPLYAYTVSDGSINDISVTSISGSWDMSTPAVASIIRTSGSGL
ncbi:hypothetical protein TNCV_3327091 [Trichonephila clavipes]|nr:hypothetical protein TNCV_3327091 [Trichonephila clavipes]